jgi:hypothetical protein
MHGRRRGGRCAGEGALSQMGTLVFSLSIITVVLVAWMQRNGMILELPIPALFRRRGQETALTRAATGPYSYLAALAVVVVVVFIALSPESRLLLTIVDAIGVDVLVALFALEFRSLVVGTWGRVRSLLDSTRRWLWSPGLGPHPKLAMSLVLGTMACIGVWVTANIVHG